MNYFYIDSDCPHDDDEPENCTFRAIGSSIAPATTPDPSGKIIYITALFS